MAGKKGKKGELSPAMQGWWAGKKGRRAPVKKGTKFRKDILTEDEVQDLIGACSSRAPSGVRNSALITLMYRTGLRVAEALSLYQKDIDREEILVLGKGGKHRPVPLPPSARTAIDHWLTIRKDLGIMGRVPVFCTLAGRKLSSPYVRTMIKRMGERAGIEKRVHPHGLRRAMACHLMDRGASMLVIQGLLGHESLSVTAKYLREINGAYLRKALSEVNWR